MKETSLYRFFVYLLFIILCIWVIYAIITDIKAKTTTSPVEEIKIDSIVKENDKLIIKVEHLDSIKDAKIIEVKNLDNDSTLKLFYQLIGK